MKIAQKCEDKGKACAGFQPSSSIWVLSSLGPGGTWERSSHRMLSMDLLPPSGLECAVQFVQM